MSNPIYSQINESLSIVAIKSIILAIPVSLAVLALLYALVYKLTNMNWHARIGFTIGCALVAYIFALYIICSRLVLQLSLEYEQYLNFNAYIADLTWRHNVDGKITSITITLVPIPTIITFIGTFFLKELKHGEKIKMRWSSRIIVTVLVFAMCFLGFGFHLASLLHMPMPSGD